MTIFVGRLEEIRIYKSAQFDVKTLYEEAREASNISLKSSAVLLRLAIEKLLLQSGAKKAGLDSMIGESVGKGFPQKVEMTLEGVRFIGNQALEKQGQ